MSQMALRKSEVMPNRVIPTVNPHTYPERQSPRKERKSPYLPPPGPTDMLKAEDLAKIFGGNQENFIMLKGLLNSTGLASDAKASQK